MYYPTQNGFEDDDDRDTDRYENIFLYLTSFICQIHILE